ncbi:MULTISPECIES: ATP-grasp domain-containing protein [unclassified Pseudomonas]|uniref:ATP-grasp domain-containing protein n=1 Tax=unclassified Pseudomonas TaxID=196821 RepID=UPI0008382AF7|nr:MULTISPECIES: ATP-grasp domain-containing protein [unclassified Pseudomonas]QIH10636.1 ATP-grasp domain-containing protein [Pseudomonas sp. BIOMIG1BAC]
MKKYVALVDVYSSGNFLPQYFKDAGIGLLHVQSTKELMPSMFGPNLDEFEHNLAFDDNAQDIVARLREFPLVAVIAGQEPGVPFADYLSEQLQLPSNGSAGSLARRNKFEMINKVAAAGLLTARQVKSSSAAQLLEWVEAGNVLPCVIKPLSSASTDGVSICHDLADVERACQEVLANQDIFGLANTEILCQSYLKGNEYIVDTVSRDGQTYVCGIWRYVKREIGHGKNIYDRDVLIAPDSDVANALVDYILQVLKALGIDNGPAHSEVIMTEQGPALVEVGARLNGNMEPRFHDISLDGNQAQLTYLAYCEPERFKAQYAGKRYKKLKEACVINTDTTLSGEVTGFDPQAIQSIENLATVHKLSVKYKVGKQMKPTVDLLSSPLRVFLYADEQQRIDQDYEQIRAYKDRVYCVR